ncbi:MAG: ester cyclase, partial [Thermomicrobiales bacterium]|nr:ester cyclase [Thermomicrobiales bacterium]
MRTVVAADGVRRRATSPDAIGVDGLAGRIAARRTSRPDLRVSHGPVIVDGDLAAAYWTVVGTDRGGLMGMAATDRVVSWKCVTILRLSGGQISDIGRSARFAPATRGAGCGRGDDSGAVAVRRSAGAAPFSGAGNHRAGSRSMPVLRRS